MLLPDETMALSASRVLAFFSGAVTLSLAVGACSSSSNPASNLDAADASSREGGAGPDPSDGGSDDGAGDGNAADAGKSDGGSDAASSDGGAPVDVTLGHGTIWYVRADGGTRYSANNPTGQCSGKADAAYPGDGTNQPCAFNDIRWLWDDQHTYGALSWVIAGGDTVILDDSKPWRTGVDPFTSSASEQPWCTGWSGGPYGCNNPKIPAGTAGAHTQILGRNWATCGAGGASTKTKMSQIFGGMALDVALNLAGAQYLDVACVEVTDHTQCVSHGSPAYPKGCERDTAPFDDADSNGVGTDATTANVLLEDVWIHGHPSSGIQGPIGGPITLERADISFNGFAGWNFDDGSDTPDAPGSSIAASYVTMQANGCNEEYPIVDAFPAVSCYDLNSGGFGDSWSGQDTELDAFTCDHCSMIYNTKDGFIGPHTTIGALTITNSSSYGNMGQQWKWGQKVGGTTIVENTFTEGNCNRLSAAMPGAPANFNQYLSLYCRAAGDMFSFFGNTGGKNRFSNNVIVGYSNTVFDLNCGTSNGCGSTPYLFENNIILGWNNTTTWSSNPGEAPNGYYLSDATDAVTEDHNLYFGLRSCPATGMGSTCTADPRFVAEPSQAWSSEAELDGFDFQLAAGSPALGAGTPVSGLTTDYSGAPYTNPPNIGAY